MNSALTTLLATWKRELSNLSEKKPTIGVVLGSGLGDFALRFPDRSTIPYAKIAGFPVPTIKGHKGELSLVTHEKKNILLFSGRFHHYEGHDADTVVLPVRLMAYLGVRTFVVTNAAGGINAAFQPGDLMGIEDHINFTGHNPLRGPNDESLGPRFPDMSEAYDRSYLALAAEQANRLGVRFQKGIYLGLPGPSYETPAEIRAYARLGADAVGMSTVLEVIAAKHAGLRVLGMSCISNLAAGLSQAPLDHREVIEVTNRVREDFARLLSAVLPHLE